MVASCVIGAADLQQGEWKKAIADYDVAINTTAEIDIEGRTNRRGFAYRNLKQYNKALEDFDEVIEARPKDRSVSSARLCLSRDERERQSDRRSAYDPETEARR